MAFLGQILAAATRELTLLAACGFLIGGIDDLAVDLIWAGRKAWRRLTVHRHHPRATARTLPPPRTPGRIAVFVAAWQEEAVIAAMLRAALDRFEHDDYRLYVGTYPNDPATQAAVRSVRDPRVRLVVGETPGPTSKGGCLNSLWAAMRVDERSGGMRFKAVVLHDAEDVVHPLELRVYDRLIERLDLVQLPVRPLICPTSRWVSAHYADEFTEAHAKQLVVREAVGAGMPSAGVGCALSRRVLAQMAAKGGGMPFPEGSLTEDYELGLRLSGFGGRGAFVVIPAGPGEPPVAVQAYFPREFETAVRQKTRWMTGIALAGWDRLGWDGSWAERWMRLRDRRSILAAGLVAVGYLSALLGAACLALGLDPRWPAWAGGVLMADTALLGWRLAIRATMVGRVYGWREGLRSMPRILVGNAVAIASAWRALTAYRPGAAMAWDKTAHHFPETVPCD